MITVSGELGELRDLHPEVSDFFAALRRANPGIVDRQGLRLVRELRWLSDHYALIQQCGAFAVRHVHDAAFCGRGEMFKGWGELLRPAAEELEHDGSLALVAHFMIGPKAHDPNDLMLASAATEMVMWAMRFHQYGRPVIALQPGQAATLAMTDTARAMSADIRAPWPAFEITLPADEVRVLLGETFTSAGRVEVAGEHNLRRIWVSAYQGEPVPPPPGGLRAYEVGHWNVYLPLENGVELHSGVRNIEELITNCEIASIAAEHAVNTVSELENRAITVASRIALSTILSIQAHGHRRRGHSEEKSLPKVERRKFRLERRHDEFIVGTPVVIGLESEVREFLTGRASFMRKTRWCTRGHWRSQAHGPSLSLRKPTWIAPHWNNRGPERIKEYVIATRKESDG